MNARPARTALLSVALSAMGLASCASDDADLLISTCEPLGVIQPICGLQRPEDMALLPDGRHLLVSMMGGLDGQPGSLAVLDTDSELHAVIYPGAEPAAAPRWGDPACPGAPGETISPHGIDLSHRLDGRWQLLVVNHGGREAVEFFELRPKGLETELVWRGCSVVPEGGQINDVVAARHGGFYVSRMKTKDSWLDWPRVMLGWSTGYVWYWTRGHGYTPVPSTEGPMPNGVELSPDEKFLFVNMSGASGVRKVRLQDGEAVAEAPIEAPDNLTWSADGRLLVASQLGSLPEFLACWDIADDDTACGYPFAIIALDPDSLAMETVFAHRGPPMGAGTSALLVNGVLYVGSYVGDRLIKVPLD